MLTVETLTRLFPQAPACAHLAFVRARETLDAAGLTQPGWRMPFFLAQVGHESDGLRRTTESLVYSRAARIARVWPARFPTAASARPYVRNPRALAERVYGGRADLGNLEPGDGARFIGRGYLQITGRANYRVMGRRIGLDLEAEPERAAEPEVAVKIACAFWAENGLNALCDTGRFAAVSRRINGGLTGYDERMDWLERAITCLETPVPTSAAPLDLTP